VRKFGRKDSNHHTLAKHAEAFGASVVDLSPLGDGVPDCLIGLHGTTWLVEFKTATGSLTDDQTEFIATWRGSPVFLVRTIEEMERLLRSTLQNRRTTKGVS